MLKGGARESENQVHTNDISLGAWNSLPAAFGAGPFSVQIKTRTHCPDVSGRLEELCSAQSPVFLRSGPFFPKTLKPTTSTTTSRSASWFPLGRFWVWSLFHADQNPNALPRCLGEARGIVFCTVTSFS